MRRLLLTLNPHDSCWELYTRGVDGIRALLGWVTGTRTVDAGVPKPAAKLLTRSLCSRFTPTFFRFHDKNPSRSPQWEPSGNDRTKRLKAGFLDKVRGNPTFTLLATNNPVEAENIFYDEKFCWELRAQRVFLSQINVLPDLDYRHVCEVFNWPKHINVVSLLQNTKVLGLMLPGVDGDFVELFVFKETQWKSLQQALSQECAALNVDFQIVDESTFKQTKWVTETP